MWIHSDASIFRAEEPSDTVKVQMLAPAYQETLRHIQEGRTMKC
jgi:hypothetical protein